MGEKAQFHIESDWNYLYKLYNHTAEPSSKIAVNRAGRPRDVSPSDWTGGRTERNYRRFFDASTGEEQTVQKLGEQAGDGEPVHPLGGDDGDGVPQLLPHIDLKLSQSLTGVYRGLDIPGQVDAGGDLIGLGLFHQQVTLPLELGLDGLAPAQEHVHRGQGTFGLGGDQGVVGKAVIQQAGGVLKALGGGGGLHHHGDEFHAVSLGGGGHAVLGGGGEARFQAGGPVVEADQAVGVGEAEGAVSEVESYLSDALVYAPVTGEVSTIIAEAGELVGTGYPVVAILDMSDVWVTFNIKEDLMPDIHIGTRMTGYIPALDRSVEFEVTYIAVQADFATWSATRTQGGFDIRTFAVKAKPTQDVEYIRPGMSVLVNWKDIAK